MLRIQKHIIRLARAATGRQALMSVLIAFITFGPIAAAACDYEHVGNVNGAGTDIYGAGIDDARSPDSSNLQSWCDDHCDAITENVRPAAVDANVGPVTPTLHALPAAFSSLSLHRVRSDPVRRQHPSPPPEPAFRRIPKLLI
jgi:hypothetical protein